MERLLIVCALLLAPLPARAGVSIVQTGGVVQVRHELYGPWSSIERLPLEVKPGDQVRTGLKASALLQFEDATRVGLGADSSAALEEASPGRVSLRLYLGRLDAAVARSSSRRFEVRTPAALCMVRGTEFQVSVLAGGTTRVDLFRGLLGVEDNRGAQVLLHSGESLTVDRGGMGVPQRLPTRSESRRRDAREAMRRELGLDRARDEALAAAEREVRLAEYQQGRVLADQSGARVRVEEYIVRTQPDRFKFVSLNKQGGVLGYFYYQGVFNKALPTDLGPALRWLGGKADSQPDYFLLSYETGRASGVGDTVRQAADGGHLVDLNGNGTAADDVTSLFDPAAGRFIDVAGRPVFQTLFDRYGLYINGRLKYGNSGVNIQTAGDALPASDTDPLTLAHLSAANAWLDPGTGLLPGRTVNVTPDSSGSLHQKVYESYTDGTYVSWDNYGLDGQGHPGSASDVGGAFKGPAFQQGLLGFNLEQAFTSSELGGRKIDLMPAPRFLVQAGLLR